MKNRIKILISGLVFLFAFQVTAQERVMHGYVTTFDSIPLIGAGIKVKSSRQIVKTDSLGKFSVGCNAEDKFKIYANGFYTQNIKVPENIKVVAINLKLKPGEKAREFAIGYGHVSDGEKLNAVANLSGSDMDFSQYSNLYDVIRGRFSGVQIMNGEIIIRGINSINSSSAALIVVDGIPADESILTTIPPVQVKSINIIKDGSAAIYGTRGANGVVIIETKRGGDK